ncbi:GGDEF domain-containing protein [Planctomycetota bacterium]|nr:GGDEF domain-containing protein [Planctomycetota bacterium]
MMQSQVRENAKFELVGGASESLGQLRVLCVGNGGLIAELSQLGEGLEIVCCENYLCALGELAIREVDVVIGPVSGMKLSAEAISKGIKRIAPNARLVLVADENVAAVDVAMGNGFEVCLQSPLKLEELQCAVHEGQVVSEVKEEVPIAVAEMGGREIEEEVVEEEGDELGDVDLVDAILDSSNGLKKVAVELVSQQSGIEGIGLLLVTDDVPNGHVSIEVEYKGRLYGVLHAPEPITVDELGMWGSWLSRWLALEDQMKQLELAAMQDDLTGAWNRRYFNRFLKKIMKRAHQDRSQVTVMVFDIDDFKLYNDRYGHAAGDEILRETVRLMQSVVRERDVVARIGGDEFAVIFWDAEEPRKANSRHPEDVLDAAKRFQRAVCACEYPKLTEEARGRLTISGGLASYPWDGRTGEELIERADLMALESKRSGKNAIMFGPGVSVNSEHC